MLDVAKYEKAYVLYCNESYIPVMEGCINSINQFKKNNTPIIAYVLNSNRSVYGATVSINWQCNVPEIKSLNKFIERKSSSIYKLLIERPRIIKDALLRYADMVAYVDSDSVATKEIDNIFSMFDAESNYPYFTEGIYEYLHMDGRGGADSKDDLSKTLEYPICELFNINQYVREEYRQTGFFVAGSKCIEFLDEWWEMCIRPEVLNHHVLYAPYHEETVVNALLWKYNYQKGLPYCYVNGSLDRIYDVYKIYGFTGANKHISEWLRIPASKENLLFFHGEKNYDKMVEMTNYIKKF